ncbi:hypothetical protein M3Y99_00414600 [Aphelenchoides fujianensis]|nr:hypothetical protein M3Y99_00414600 [Aphelenchoides fujianensis]
MHPRPLCLLLVLLIGVNVASGVLHAVKRQTYYYPEDLRKYARPHANTKFLQGTVGRYAPREWPAWYTRTIFRWNGESRLSPYHPNDVRYLSYQQARLRGE